MFFVVAEKLILYEYLHINLYVNWFQYSICIRSIKTKTNLINTLLLYPSLSLTDRQRNKYTRFTWAGGTCPRYVWAGGTFSPVVQFLVLAVNRFWFYILLMYLGYRTIQLWCCVSFFGSGGKLFLVWRMYLVYNTVVRLRQFFCCGGKVNFVQIPYSHDRFSKISRTFFVKKLIPY